MASRNTVFNSRADHHASDPDLAQNEPIVDFDWSQDHSDSTTKWPNSADTGVTVPRSSSSCSYFEQSQTEYSDNCSVNGGVLLPSASHEHSRSASSALLSPGLSFVKALRLAGHANGNCGQTTTVDYHAAEFPATTGLSDLSCDNSMIGQASSAPCAYLPKNKPFKELNTCQSLHTISSVPPLRPPVASAYECPTVETLKQQLGTRLTTPAPIQSQNDTEPPQRTEPLRLSPLAKLRRKFRPSAH